MSRDIRSFFTVISKKSATDSKKPDPPPLSLKKKKPKKLIDSDDEDIISPTPEKSSPKKQPTKRPLEILSSDSEDETTKSKSKFSKKSETKENTANLKPVSVGDVFKNVPVKQSKVEFTPKQSPEKKSEAKEKKKSKSKKKNVNTELGVHEDPAFEKTLIELDDDDFFEQNLDILEKTELEALEQDEKKENGATTSETEKNKNGSGNNKKENSPKVSEKKRSRKDSSSDNNTPKKKKIEHTDSGIDPGQEAHEKKRYSAMLYQKYLNRSGPKHHGMKELPKGKPDCLNNLCFLRTGVLDSLDSEEFDNLIKQHGGRTVHAVSKKVNYVVVGEDAGPSKLAKAESYNIPRINEDELLDLILVKSGKEPKYSKKDTSLSSEDLGIEADNQVTLSPEKNKTQKDKKEETKDRKENKEEQVKTKSPENSDPKSKCNKDHKTSSPSSSEANKTKKAGQSEFSIKPSEQIATQDVSLTLPLTEKYKPKDLKGIIGQQGEGSNMRKLKHWLENWHKNQDPKIRKSLVKPSPWAKNDNGAYFKCALLSGPPGVGKTTTATLVAQELGLDIVEFNASDTRSKKLLHEEVSQLLSSKTLAGYAAGQTNVTKNRVLLMDEVDGMAGNEDRGGMQELIQLIKTSNVPIICMCNDRNHPKIRSLVNYCFDLRFNKPRLEQIKGAMMSVCFKEQIKIPANALTEIIAGTGCDVRQTLNHLSMLATTGESLTVEEAKSEASRAKKDTVMGPWEVCRAVFTESEHKDMSVADKARLFFYDYSIGPLFVQENYLKVQPKGDKKQVLLRVAKAADAISMGDLIDAKIRSSNNWALLETQAMFSSVLPGHYMSGNFVGQINFPAWLGKNSKKNKFSRLLSEIQAHTRTSASASKMAVRLDYLVPLKEAILQPLRRGMDGIDEAVQVMKDYNLLREDLDGLLELCQWKRGENAMANIETKVKSAFTRAYNKQVTLLPYAPNSGVTKKKAAAAENDLYGEEEDYVESDDEDEDISKNAMIKVKKPAAKGKKKTDEAGPSKTKESKKGKGKKK